ncbi:MAG: hypothetical protein GEU28_00160 [Dehalococcoidia bacterium]|nr:hypothetical protein [Dehalococcoidia bacterium]
MFVLALLVFALFLPPFELLSGDDDASSPAQIADVCDGVSASIPGDIPTVPQNLVAESPLRELEANTEPCGPLDIILNLTTMTQDGENLGFYTHDNGAYRPVVDAVLTSDGTAVEGQLPQLPENVIVMRRTAAALRVEGFLPEGAAIDSAAPPGLLTAVNPVAYSPQVDGALLGVAPAVTGEFQVVPVIRADTEDEVTAAETILGNDVAAQTHIQAITTEITNNGYDGIEID